MRPTSACPPRQSQRTAGQIIDVSHEGAPIFALSRLPAFLQSVFNSNHAILLLDGVDELSPTDIEAAVDYLKLLLKAYPRLRVVTTGTLDHLAELIGFGFVPLAVMPWSEFDRDQYIETWAELWTRYVSVEAWAQASYDPVDPFMLNQWILQDNNIGLTPLEFTLKVWGTYAGDLRGPRAMDAHRYASAPASPRKTRRRRPCRSWRCNPA